MRKNGFTLIELLAVIVILAIIALIATPIILGIINDAREESQERSVELYASAVRNGIAAYQLREMKEVAAGTYTSEELPFDVEYDGDVECTTIELYEDGGVYVAGCTVNDLAVEYTYGTQQFKTYKNGDVVYYDVDNGVGCEGLYTASQSNTGVKTGCMKFYAFNDDGGDTLNLILDHNTTAMVAWNSDGDNTNGPSEVTAQLKSDTNDWKGTITPANYEYKGSARPYTVDYSDYKARLITANEIAQITKNEGWDEASTTAGYYYFHDLSQNYKTGRGNVCASTGCTYGWLYDRTYTECTNYGCFNNSDVETHRYWTVSSNASYSDDAWGVDYDGYASNDDVNRVGYYGVRPVITILKSQI